MAHYLYTLRLSRPEAFDDPTELESTAIGEHFAYLQGLVTEGVLDLAGPCLDGAFGLVLFERESDEEARATMERDPAVQSGVMTAELHPFRVSLRGWTL